jgi:hypothetical protein
MTQVPKRSPTLRYCQGTGKTIYESGVTDVTTSPQAREAVKVLRASGGEETDDEPERLAWSFNKLVENATLAVPATIDAQEYRPVQVVQMGSSESFRAAKTSIVVQETETTTEERLVLGR